MAALSSGNGTSVIRGQVLSYKANPFRKPLDGCVRYEPDGLVVMQDGAVGCLFESGAESPYEQIVFQRVGLN